MPILWIGTGSQRIAGMLGAVAPLLICIIKSTLKSQFGSGRKKRKMEGNMNVVNKSKFNFFILLLSLITGLIGIIVGIFCGLMINKIGLKNAPEYGAHLFFKLYYYFIVASILAAISLVIAYYKKNRKTWSVVLLCIWIAFAIFFISGSREMVAPFIYAVF